MRGVELAAILAVIIVTSIAIFGFSLYYKTNGGTINDPYLPSLPSIPAQKPEFNATNVELKWTPFLIGIGSNTGNLTLSMRVNDGAQANLKQVAGSVDGNPVGICTLNLLPNHYLPCSMSGNVSCSMLLGGLPYSMKLVATFANGQTSEFDSTIAPVYSNCP
jgi:hypothetical protein